MKKSIKAFLYVALAMPLFFSCKKEIAKVTYDGGTNPLLTASDSLTPTILSKAHEKDVWQTFHWTNPNYEFSTGLNSQDVVYTLQFDTAGSNFSNPQEIVISKDLSRQVTVKDLNGALAKLGLAENIPHNIEIRLKSSLINSSVPLYSSVLHTVLTPYLDVVVSLPSSGDLFLVGDATSGGWDNPVPEPAQKFTKIDNTTYEIVTHLTGGKEYLFLPVNGSWDHKYAVANKTLNGLSGGGDFGYDLSDNFPGPSSDGDYRIRVDFKTGKFTVTRI